jgi:MerR family mercuric resistance operon transcriptional regulator
MGERTIGQLAEEAGVNVETVRYYERRGLLARPERPSAGYRRYGDDHAWRLALIRRAKGLGLTLDDIAELLADAPDGTPRTEEEVLRVASSRLAALDEDLASRVVVRDRLASLVDGCRSGDEGCATLGA